MKFLSQCSGIEAASVAWNPIGWEAVGFSEIEPFPCALLKHHYPEVPNFGDMTKFMEWPDATIDVLCGGTPCQSFSVAGLRKGLDDPRGNLMLTFLATAKRYRPSWVVWENVPGVLSSNGGRDFGTFLGGLAECGYGFAYRVLDAQYFGLAQRRKRVFVVGYLGDWHRAAAVLFEQHSLQGHPAPRREKGKDVAGTLKACAGESGGWSNSVDHAAPTIGGGFDAQAFDWQSGGDSRGLDPKPTAQLQRCQVFAVLEPVTYDFFNITAPVNRQSRTPGDPCHTLARSNAEHAVVMEPVAFHPTQDPISSTKVRHAIGANENATAAVAFRDTADCLTSAYGTKWNGNASANNGSLFAAQAMQVRRLTPEECEALQGFPRGYTAIPWRGKPASECPDGPRYKALGNSWAVPVVRWIGERINKVEAWTS